MFKFDDVVKSDVVKFDKTSSTTAKKITFNSPKGTDIKASFNLGFQVGHIH